MEDVDELSLYKVDTGGQNIDEAILAQTDRIEKEIAASQPLIGDHERINSLHTEYGTEDAVYQAKISHLESVYSVMRRTRGDGNCFFRAFGFAHFERLMADKDEMQRFKAVAAKYKGVLFELGYTQFTVEDFHDVMLETLENLEKKPTLDELLATFRDQGLSDYLVVFLRLITSAHLQKEEAFFENFIDGNRPVKEFCSQEVEPPGKESDHLHIIALTQATGVGVRVAYMDRTQGGKVTIHDFPEGCDPMIHLLYRPGHYDILYK